MQGLCVFCDRLEAPSKARFLGLEEPVDTAAWPNRSA